MYVWKCVNVWAGVWEHAQLTGGPPLLCSMFKPLTEHTGRELLENSCAHGGTPVVACRDKPTSTELGLIDIAGGTRKHYISHDVKVL